VRNELAKWLVYLLSFWLAFWPAGISCVLSEQHPQAEAQPRARDAPWEVSIGSRGGVTGGGSGHLIRSDGEVYSWTQATVGSARTTRRLGRATPDALHALEQAVELRAQILESGGARLHQRFELGVGDQHRFGRVVPGDRDRSAGDSIIEDGAKLALGFGRGDRRDIDQFAPAVAECQCGHGESRKVFRLL